MKYLIHAVPCRLWYVQKYIIPSMLQQGIKFEDIDIYIDSNQDGNLRSTIKSFSQLPAEGITCHLQDDIVIAKDFRKKIERNRDQKNYAIAECGFCSIYDEYKGPQAEMYAWTDVKNMWYSFQCIIIPNKVAHEFVVWVKEQWDNNNGKYWLQISNNMFDDYLFKSFLCDKHSTASVFLHVPNLVDHVDYLMGGSTLSKRDGLMKSMYFDQQIIDDLEKLLVD